MKKHLLHNNINGINAEINAEINANVDRIFNWPNKTNKLSHLRL